MIRLLFTKLLIYTIFCINYTIFVAKQTAYEVVRILDGRA